MIDHLPRHALFSINSTNKDAEEQVIQLDNEAQQIHYLAHYLDHKVRCNPKQRIGIILPRHSDQHNVIAPACNHAKHALNCMDLTKKMATLIPDPISKHPLIKALNTILSFFVQPNTEKLIAVFKQPCFTCVDKLVSYQACLTQLQNIPWSNIKRMCAQSRSPFKIKYPDIWQRIAIFIQNEPPERCDFINWQAWAKQTLGYFLEEYKPIDSQEQALFQLWLDCLHRCHTLGQDQQHDHDTWVEYFILTQKNTYFNTQSASEAQFVLMSWSHAINMTFDELIFVSNHAGNWPGNIMTEQKQINQAVFWQQIQSQIRKTCQKITYLFPKHDAQMQVRLPSALVPSNVIIYKDTTPQNTYPQAQIANTSKWTNFGSPPKQEQLTISTSVLQGYSRCHAQGYFQHRLHVRTPEEKFYGIDAMDMGNLVHHMLQELDQIHEDSLPDSQQQAQVIAQCIDKNPACQYLTRIQKSTLQSHLESVIQSWLTYRIEAHGNEQVINSRHEVVMQKALMGVTLNMRMDRIDQLEDGSYRIVDYKTGMVNRADWLSTRPQNPQLIAYALSLENTSSIAYASLHPDYYGYQGYCAEQSPIKNIKPIHQITLSAADETPKVMNSWPTQIRMWESSLSEIIKAYREGSLLLNPAQGKTTCQQCQLQALCRIHERNIV